MAIELGGLMMKKTLLLHKNPGQLLTFTCSSQSKSIPSRPKCKLSLPPPPQPPPAVHFLVGQLQIERHQFTCNHPKPLQNPALLFQCPNKQLVTQWLNPLYDIHNDDKYFNKLNWNRMVMSMVKSKWILQ